MKLLLGLVGAAASACASVEHVSITPLPPDPTPQQRMWFYETYHPTAKGEEIITVCNGNACNSTRHPLVRLGDGRVVRDPDDLAPLVAPDSHMLAESRRAHRADLHAHLWALGTVVAVVAGLAIGVDGHNNNDSGELGLGVGIGAGGLLVGAIGAYIVREHAHDARVSAFSWYPHDLAEKLHVCWTGAQTVPCETITPGAAPEKPVDPNLDQLRPR